MQAQIDAVRVAIKDYTRDLTEAQRQRPKDQAAITLLSDQIDQLHKTLELLRALRDRAALDARITAIVNG